MNKKKLLSWHGIAALALVGLLGVSNANADLLVDRGLPTDNLNNAAGASRSNVAWVFGGTSANYWLVGDSITNTSSQTWSIDTIRLWTVGGTSTAALWGGMVGTTMGLLSGSSSISSALYSNSATYQGYSGGFINMYQVDFAVNILLAAGETFDFFLDGTGGSYTVPFAHASNAALSGSLQDGADNLMLAANILNGSLVSVEDWTSLGNGWDKASDVNVQVFGEAVPEPATLALVALGIAGLGFGRRRKV